MRSFVNATPDLKPKLYFFLLNDEAIFFQSLNEIQSLSQDDVIIKKINGFCPILQCLAPLLLLPYFCAFGGSGVWIRTLELRVVSDRSTTVLRQPHDTQHNDTRHNDIQRNDTQHNITR
jgi:hypothetical protein